MKIPLVAVSRPLHSGVCETRQDAGLPVIHSAISDSGRLRTRGGQLSAQLISRGHRDQPALPFCPLPPSDAKAPGQSGGHTSAITAASS